MMAQERLVTGIVQDEKKSPLEGATVAIRKSTVSTVTKADGKFSIRIPNGKASLVVSFVGYEHTTVTVGETQTTIAVTLPISNTSKMDEVVIVGVQSQSKKRATMAISTVLSKDIENLPSPSIDQLLQGRVPGMNVQITSGEPGVAPTIVVRGNSRVSTNIGDASVSQARALSGPLYVIDGIPTNPGRYWKHD
jgi:hypothetical protein